MSINRGHMEVRRPMVAGSFYPDNPVELAKQLAGFFRSAEKRNISGEVKAIVAPHAGYIYSGQIAADAYKQIEGTHFDAVVVIAPFHGFFKGVSVYSGGAYQTPLGVVEIDRDLSDTIANKLPDVYGSTVGHTGSGGRGEHSLEVQLPFLQTVLGKFKLVAMVMGDQEESTIRAAAEALTVGIKGRNVLVVASTDMSHFYSEKEANRLDKNFEKALLAFNTQEIINTIASGQAEACGFGPVAATVETMRRVGGKTVEIINYGTSGATTGDFSEVVGYLSAVIIGDKVAPKRLDTMGTPRNSRAPGYTNEEKAFLINVARDAVNAAAAGTKFQIPPTPSPQLGEKRGVFVTIYKRGMLRGCIGLVQARLPLVEAVRDMAVAAAFDDPRFHPVEANELAELEYEISVMSPLSQVNDLSEIEVGRHGLMIRLEAHSGLLLPQVAVENTWDRTEFLEQTCLKAGLPKNSYRDKQAHIYKFTADKF